MRRTSGHRGGEQGENRKRRKAGRRENGDGGEKIERKTREKLIREY